MLLSCIEGPVPTSIHKGTHHHSSRARQRECYNAMFEQKNIPLHAACKAMCVLLHAVCCVCSRHQYVSKQYLDGLPCRTFISWQGAAGVPSTPQLMRFGNACQSRGNISCICLREYFNWTSLQHFLIPGTKKLRKLPLSPQIIVEVLKVFKNEWRAFSRKMKRSHTRASVSTSSLVSTS